MDASAEGIERHAEDGEHVVWVHSDERGSAMLTRDGDGYRIRADRAGQLAVSDHLPPEAALGLAAAIILADEWEHQLKWQPTLSHDEVAQLAAVANGPVTNDHKRAIVEAITGEPDLTDDERALLVKVATRHQRLEAAIEAVTTPKQVSKAALRTLRQVADGAGGIIPRIDVSRLDHERFTDPRHRLLAEHVLAQRVPDDRGDERWNRRAAVAVSDAESHERREAAEEEHHRAR